MAQDVAHPAPPDGDSARVEPVVPPAEPEPLVEPSLRRAPQSVYRVRFAIAYVALALVAGGAVGAAILLIDSPPDARLGAWSPWQPTGPKASYAEQIAEHVSGRYRLESGRELVGVIAGQPEFGGIPVQGVFIQHRSPLRTQSSDTEFVSTDESVMYQLCGLGESCSISEGEPSAERLNLLKRESLELALYTFKYVDGAKSVITILPTQLRDPADPNDDTTTMLFFERSHLKAALGRPLRTTLNTTSQFQVTELPPDALVVDRLTRGRFYRFELTRLPTGAIAMLLAPLQPAE